MLTEAPNGLPAGEVSWFGRHALNMPPASQPQVPHAAAAPHPLERHPPPPHCNLHMTSRRGWRPQSLDVARRLAGDIHDDAPSWGGRPSPPRARPGTAVGRIVASSSKRGHAPATGDHFAGPKNWLPTLGAEPYVKALTFCDAILRSRRVACGRRVGLGIAVPLVAAGLHGGLKEDKEEEQYNQHEAGDTKTNCELRQLLRGILV